MFTSPRRSRSPCPRPLARCGCGGIRSSAASTSSTGPRCPRRVCAPSRCSASASA
ncbi:hypothetical protein ACFPRL_20670 [Pseudoclavibacter helvolus]